MFKKLLIANRGEIAVRIARACRELGISPVAVYSEADRTSLHVRVADEAVHVGKSASVDSYLVSDKIIAAARSVGAEAIHPGYGFLSESADFADAVEAAGLAFVGPPASAMSLMGSKTNARKLAESAGAPVVPGTNSPLASLAEAQSVAEEIGFPIMLKAASGGGGKGLRLVRAPEQLESAYSLAQSEAAASFNDSSVYIEKYLERPRHIEIQVVADQHGNIAHLGERECSLQRRHQKVIEECPSPIVDEALRDRMCEAAVRVARAAGYVNAGTIEFLLDQRRNFYFMEMNTRLQVEHPVTELVTGRDLVHEQIRIAAGEKLSFSQDEVVRRGASIECRLYAEDPASGFMPSPGLITTLVEPAGPGVRFDSGSYPGWEVPIHYDPLLAKLCVWAETRDAAVNRLTRALNECAISGIKTNLIFFREIVRSPDFRRGDFDTGFIDRFLSGGSAPAVEPDEYSGGPNLADLAAIAAVLHTRSASRSFERSSPAVQQSRWKRESRREQQRS